MAVIEEAGAAGKTWKEVKELAKIELDGRALLTPYTSTRCNMNDDDDVLLVSWNID